MKTKLHFKLIGLLITISLVALIGFQGYWLNGVYKSLRIQLDKDVQEAMLHADYKELFTRMRRLKEKQKLEKLASVKITYDDEENFMSEVPIEDDLELEPMNTVEVNFSNEFEDEFSDEFKTTNPFEADSALIKYFRTVQQIQNMILHGLHSFTDTLEAVRFHEYDSLLVNELKTRGINAQYQIHLVQIVSPEHTIFQTLSKSYPGAVSDTTSAPLDWKNAVYYDYPIYTLSYPEEEIYLESEPTLNNPMFYRLSLKNPTGILLNQMRGILISSFLLVLVIVISFIYLLRTIFRQKTVEELKTDFTNNMTHELKTPISVSYAAVDALLNFGSPIDEKQRHYLSIVKEQLTHLTGLVEQTLTLAVENRDTFRLHPEPILLCELIQSLIEQHRLKNQQQIDFDVDIPSGLRLTADRTHLYNMLNNLIDNAIKYNDKEICRIRIVILKEDKKVKIHIEDNGQGISQVHQATIFEKFYRIPSGNLHNVKGHGLGLFYVRHIMEKHDGTVHLRSTIGKGSLFSLIFPE